MLVGPFLPEAKSMQKGVWLWCGITRYLSPFCQNTQCGWWLAQTPHFTVYSSKVLSNFIAHPSIKFHHCFIGAIRSTGSSLTRSTVTSSIMSTPAMSNSTFSKIANGWLNLNDGACTYYWSFNGGSK